MKKGDNSPYLKYPMITLSIVAWNAHDLDGVMDLFHEGVVFENWTGGTAQLILKN